MTQPRRDGFYIWVTRSTRLFVGENSCERSSWAWDQHGNRSWDRGQRFRPDRMAAGPHHGNQGEPPAIAGPESAGVWLLWSGAHRMAA